jgi:hypothetical protein
VIRRFTALAATAFLLNLNVIGVDRACGPTHDTATQSDEHAGHAGHTPTPAPASNEAPAKCCDALSSCGMTLSFGGDVSASTETPTFTSARPVVMRAPSSVLRAPEPPPPRA